MIKIPKSIYHEMVKHAKKEFPRECCGILGGKGDRVEKVFDLENAEKSPIRYSISPQEQMRVYEEMEKGAMEMVAIYHSHPQTIPFPSETDVKFAFSPEVASIIISLKEEEPMVKAFRINKEAIYLEEMEILP
jgi:proteasome lid subunit RPN8/RPN11